MEIKASYYFAKKLSDYLAEKCDTCGKDRISSVFSQLLNRKKILCSSCKITRHIINTVIQFLSLHLRISKERLLKLLEKPLYQRTIINLVKGISTFGVMKPQPTNVPVVIVWNFTNQCNLNCLHCHQDSGEMAHNYNELNTEQGFKVIDNMANAGISVLTFSGGEPLLRPDLFELAHYASSNDLLCTVATNGTLLTHKVVDKLTKAGIQRIEIGLDGIRPEIHDGFRNTPGAFEKTVEGIKICAENGNFQEIAVTATLNKLNVQEIPKIIEFAETLGATRFYLNRLIPAGRGARIFDMYDVTSQEKFEALKYLYEKLSKSITQGNGIKVYARGMTYYGRYSYTRSQGKIFTVGEALSGYDNLPEFDEFSNEFSKIVHRFASGFGGCTAGITYAGLTAQGDLQPCVPAPQTTGNLLKDDLENIWVNSRLLNHIRKRNKLKGHCGNCQFNFLCGGCRFTGFVGSGDWLGPDVSCPYNHHT